MKNQKLELRSIEPELTCLDCKYYRMRFEKNPWLTKATSYCELSNVVFDVRTLKPCKELKDA